MEERISNCEYMEHRSEVEESELVDSKTALTAQRQDHLRDRTIDWP